MRLDSKGINDCRVETSLAQTSSNLSMQLRMTSVFGKRLALTRIESISKDHQELMVEKVVVNQELLEKVLISIPTLIVWHHDIYYFFSLFILSGLTGKAVCFSREYTP